QQMKPSFKDPLRRPHWEYTSSNKEMAIGNRIVLVGQVMLQELDNVALATAMLFGLMYALNLDYPPELKYRFEVLQKVVMELEGTTLSKKDFISELSGLGENHWIEGSLASALPLLPFYPFCFSHQEQV
ncbi:hypothetical protein NFI96_006584, partial [Prochilodus magdalenae]